MLDTATVHRLTIRQNQIIYGDSLKRFKKRPPLNAPIRVVFLGEPAIDVGEPLREYLTLLMKEVVLNNPLFSGPNDFRGIMHSMQSIEAKAFFMLAR